MSSEEDGPHSDWISSLLDSPYGDFLCRVDNEYIRDRFNLTYLEREIPNFKKAFDVILGDFFDAEYQEDAIRLYGLIHARYILTPSGLSKMNSKFKERAFGTCQRVLCENNPVLPVGISDRPNQCSMRVFCPRCRDIYIPRSKRGQAFDGAWFGTTFPHFLLQSYKEHGSSTAHKVAYVPRIFGFKLAH